MQFTTAFAAFVALASATLASAGPVVEARAESIFYCGKQPYRKSEYTCYPKNGNLLCPIVNGVVYFPCGWGKTGACYDPSNYGCKNGKLYLLDNCGGVVYDHNSYVCVGGYLCPIDYPLRCGAACYNAKQYWCDKGILKQVGQK